MLLQDNILGAGFDLTLSPMNRNKFSKIVIFWLFAITPFLGIVFLTTGWTLIILILLYALVYRPLLHAIRLIDLGMIDPKAAWKLFIPFYGTRFLRALWLG